MMLRGTRTPAGGGIARRHHVSVLLPRPWLVARRTLAGRLLVSADSRQGTAGTKDSAVKDPFSWRNQRLYRSSDGTSHLGSALDGGVAAARRPFPGPPPGEGPPLRVLPIGGLGEIGMNCMMVGVHDRYILIDAGLMFPDFSDLGMQKILPDTSFLARWKDKIEAVVITHGHEDHIGALPWVLPALDPCTPVYAGSFVMQLVARRLQEFALYDPARFHVVDMNRPMRMGPFEVTPIRVTHSIPDCCGLVLRSEHGTIVHTGDWKIDEDPVDGEVFDREAFDIMGKEPVSLMMSDSTNVLSPGRTSSERVVEEALAQHVLSHAGKGRVIVTQFASNLHRLASVKKAADASGRRICFVGASLNTYLEAAKRDGRAPLDPAALIKPEQLEDYDPNQVLVITTGSQAEPRAQLCLAAQGASHNLKLQPSDMLLYSAKVIPGNETKVSQLLNSVAMTGARVVQDRRLHVSGHAYQDELSEVLRFVRPQHFLPVHGEYAFLCEHARLARDTAGVSFTSVIRNGQMLGVHERRSRTALSSGSGAVAEVAAVKEARRSRSKSGGGGDEAETPESGMRVLGEAHLQLLYNDGGRGTGNAAEMALPERSTLAFEGVIVAAVDVVRASAPPPPAAGEAAYAAPAGGARRSAPGGLRCRCRITTRGMWLDRGSLLGKLHEALEAAVNRLPADAALGAVERQAVEALKKAARSFNNRRPEVIVVAYEHDARLGVATEAAAARRAAAGGGGGRDGGGGAFAGRGGRGGGGAFAGRSGRGGRGGNAGVRPWEAATGGASPPPLQPVPPGMLEARRAANPRERPGAADGDVAFD